MLKKNQFLRYMICTKYIINYINVPVVLMALVENAFFFFVSINLIDSNEQAFGAFVQLVDKNILFNG